MRVLVPGYPAIVSVLKQAAPLHEYARLFGGKATLVAGTAAGLDLIVLDAPHLFDRPGNPYLAPGGSDWSDNWKRFAALSRVAADIGTGKLDAFHPDVVHCHDWHAGLVPVLLHYARGPAARSVMTIHNLAFQGVFPPAVFPSLGLPDAAFTVDGVEYYGSVSFMKGGLQFADAITTVSPSYAAEICTPGGGMGFDGLLRARRDVLSGILNGIDTDDLGPGQRRRAARRLYGHLARPPRRQPRRRRSSLRPRADRRHGLRRGQPADLAEGHGCARRVHRRPRRPRRPPGRARHRRCGAGGHVPRRRLAPSRPRRRDRRLRRASVASAPGRCRRHPGALALRALRAHPVLRPALRLRAGGGARRRPRRFDRRRQRGGHRGGGRDRHPVHAGGARRPRSGDGARRRPPRRARRVDAHAEARHEDRRFLDRERRPLCRALSQLAGGGRRHDPDHRHHAL